MAEGEINNGGDIMPYTKIGFANGDVLLASDLNHIEDGIANLDTDKQDKLQGAPGQTVGFDSDGNVVIQDISGVTMTQVENYANQVSSAALSEAKSYSDTQISTHNSSNLSHEDIRNSISGITTSMGTLNQEVDSIASAFIGRNLVRNSAEMTGNYWSDTAESDNKYRSERSDGVWQWNLSNTGLTADSWLSITVNCGDTAYPYLQVGDVFTCSVQYFVDSSKTPVDPSFYIEARGVGGNGWGENLTLNSNQIVQDKWTKISFTYTVTQETETILKLIFGLRKNGNVSFAHPKVEKGTVATDWSVAPEDSVNHSNGTLSSKIKANALAIANLSESQIRNITISNVDLVAGESPLPTGEVYFVYE